MSIALCTAVVLVLLDLESSSRAAPHLHTVLPQALPRAASTQRLCLRSAWGPGLGLGLGLAALRRGVRAPSNSCGEQVSPARPAAALAAAAAAMRWARRRSLPPNICKHCRYLLASVPETGEERGPAHYPQAGTCQLPCLAQRAAPFSVFVDIFQTWMVSSRP